MRNGRAFSPSTLARLLPAAWMLVPALLIVALPAAAQEAAGEAEIDRFMQEVLARRNANWEDLYSHTVRDREVLELTGPAGRLIESYESEYVWYVRDGFMVRSPVTWNGAAVSDEKREEAEQEFLRRARERQEKRAEALAAGDSPEREQFLGFPYEPGHYLLAGRESVAGRETLVIEYYPARLFEGEDEEEEPTEEEARWRQRFAKTSRITLWVLPEERQIVRVHYDSVTLDFLPMSWLVQVDGIGATLEMTRPFPDEEVWLPESIRIRGAFTMATGSFEVDYRLDYYDYREAETKARVRYRLPDQRP